MGKSVFNYGTKDKYIEQKHFEMKVTNIFLSKHYEMKKTKAPIIINRPGKEGIQFIQTLTQMKQKPYQTVAGMFETLNEIFRSQHNEPYYHVNTVTKEPG